jgi:hypothetical protein
MAGKVAEGVGPYLKPHNTKKKKKKKEKRKNVNTE